MRITAQVDPLLSPFRLPADAARAACLGFGGAAIGNLYDTVDEETALAAVEAAWHAGIRYFDTAPFYGYGLSEQRLGRALAAFPRTSYALSTKVGRCVSEDTDAASRREGFAVAGRRAEFDYSRDGVLRAFESSLARLCTDRVEILLLHDVGRLTHGKRHAEVLRQALDEALPAMRELQATGACGAIGIGVNEQDVALELLPHAGLDCVMLAGRYTLLEQGALPLLEQAQRLGVAILAAGPFNSGLLAGERAPGATYDYGQVPAAVRERAQRLYAVCALHGVDVGAAALQFPSAHAAVAAVVAGMRTPAEAAIAALRMRSALPQALWRDLRAEGLIEPGAPAP